mgnify:CR=1 FL=1
MIITDTLINVIWSINAETTFHTLIYESTLNDPILKNSLDEIEFVLKNVPVLLNLRTPINSGYYDTEPKIFFRNENIFFGGVFFLSKRIIKINI